MLGSGRAEVNPGPSARPGPALRVLVTGASGLLGGRLAALLDARGFAVIAGRHHAPVPPGLPEVPLDLGDPAAVARAFRLARPDAVLHAAAFARADDCERRPADAEMLNHHGSRRLAEACRAAGLRLVALSTDLVFSGERGRLTEDVPPRPVLAYGRTKLAGEEAVLAAHPGAAVARVALVVGRGHGPGGTASETVAWALADGRPLSLFTDEHRSPVDPESLAGALAALLSGGATGRFHLGGPERLSRHELGLRVARTTGLPATTIRAARQADHPGPAPRPPDVSLDSTRARRELGWAPRPLDEALAESRPAPG